MPIEVKYPAKIRHWRQVKTWKKDHAARGAFKAVVAGEREELVIPVFIHPCSVCGKPDAPFGVKGIWYCGEHRP